ncbi:MAG TPA: MoxR family ATPase [Thermoanaerobaculia bacterium]|nr:MoxR family ATPase [Thermoanaerobaculia bacterium]
MTWKRPFYQGDTKTAPAAPAELPASRRAELTAPAGYWADEGLVDAVNVAILLGQPLLLTGQPGTGKTQLASSLAWSLGLGKPLKFETKSTSTSRDLFYTYDALGRFQARESGASSRAVDYLTYGALGLAILRANEEAAVAAFLPAGTEHGGRRRSVALIDEIDKAPRDFPNDILNEIEEMYFRVPELGNAELRAEPAMQPVVVITSNSEKDLPDAFLRRCVYYHLPFPDRERLTGIVERRLGALGKGGSELLADVMDLFFLLRDPASNLRKQPSTAELLGWLIALRQHGEEANPLAADPGLALRTLSSLVKTHEDQERTEQVVSRWIQARRPR